MRRTRKRQPSQPRTGAVRAVTLAFQAVLPMALAFAPFGMYLAADQSTPVEPASSPTDLLIVGQSPSSGKLRGLLLARARTAGRSAAVRLPASTILANGRGGTLLASELFDYGGASFVAEGVAATFEIERLGWARVFAMEPAASRSRVGATPPPGRANLSAPAPAPTSAIARERADALAWLPPTELVELDRGMRVRAVRVLLSRIRAREIKAVLPAGRWVPGTPASFAPDWASVRRILGGEPPPRQLAEQARRAAERGTVEVLNAGGGRLAAQQAGERLDETGFEVMRVGGFTGDPVRGTVVLYRTDRRVGEAVAAVLESRDIRPLSPEYVTAADVLVLVGT